MKPLANTVEVAVLADSSERLNSSAKFGLVQGGYNGAPIPRKGRETQKTHKVDTS